MSWLAAYFRFPALFANDFHNDEALFASWARLIAIWRDPLLQGQPVDKPPLAFYLQAAFYPMLGPVEWAARLPGFIASLLLVPLVGMVVWQLYRDELAAVMAALLLALSPLAIQFSATAFTDPWLTICLVMTLYWVIRCGNGWRAGFCFGLAIASKHQAWSFLPLVVALALSSGWRGRNWRQAVLGFIPWLILLISWEVVRTGHLALWSNQINNFGGLRLAWSWELLPRWNAWKELWRWVVGWPFLLLIIPLSTWPFRPAPDQRAAANQLLLLYLAGYFVLHWLLAVPVWDRYLLPVVPLAICVLAWSLSRLLGAINARVCEISLFRSSRAYGADSQLWSRGPELMLLSLLLLAQLTPAMQARRGRFPIGGQPGADHGAAKVAQVLAGAPYGTVLYDHWYSWQWRYQLLDRRVYVSWFPHPDALVADLLAFGTDGQPRFLALPRSGAARPVRRAVNQAGFQLLPVPGLDQAAIALYQVMPQERTGE